MSTVTYIEHSGFLVELEDRALLFDYYKGDIPDSGKPLYIFSSHRHHDHFNKKIMEMPCERLILSSDIRVVPNEKTLKTGPNKTIETDGMSIKTLRSTDEGVAFIIEYTGLVIYLAGDLNDWYWEGESDEWNRKMTENYRRIIIEGFKDIKKVDMAFLPVDSRLGKYSMRGADFFLENVNVGRVFPMHFWGEHDVVKEFCQKHKNACCITHTGQNFHKEEKI